MKLVVVFALVVCAFATEVATTDADAAKLHKHYDVLKKMVAKSSDALESAAMTEIGAHLANDSTMNTIATTCEQMKTEISQESQNALKEEHEDTRVCSETLANYKQDRQTAEDNKADFLKEASKFLKKWSDIEDQPANNNATRVSLKTAIESKEVAYKSVVEASDAAQVDFLGTREAYMWALANVSVIHRVLNGEGTLDEYAGRGSFLEEAPISKRIQALSLASTSSRMNNMLKIYSRSFSLLEAKDKTTGDMDAVNTLLVKIRENLTRDLKTLTDQNNNRIALDKASRLERRHKINENWQTYYNNYKDSGEIEEKIGQWIQDEGNNRFKAAKQIKIRDQLDIMIDFLQRRCTASRRAFSFLMAQKANEMNALSAVLQYLHTEVFPTASAWHQTSDVVSTVYKWETSSGLADVYIDVKNTWSTIDNQDDAVVCRQPYATVFSKVRVLTEKTTGRKFLDPNDMKHTKFKEVNRNHDLKDQAIECQMFPAGIPLGRAQSCSRTRFAHGQIDLTGTPYKFGNEAKNMFKILGLDTGKDDADRETRSRVELSSNGKKLTMRVKGKCGDVYGDDSPNPDYRSDFIPLK